MGIEAMRIFCDVAQQRSFSKGAALNGITQSAASQRIRGLEEELGVRLIDRSVRPLGLTAAGTAYHRGSLKILDRYERLKAEVTGTHHALRGHVEIAAIYSSGIGFLNRVKSEFEAEHPGTHVHIRYDQPQAVHDEVRADRCDLGILSYPYRWSTLESIPLREEPIAVVCRVGHALVGRGSVGPEDLAGQRLVGFDARLPISREIALYLKRHGVTPAVENAFDNVDTIRATLVETDAVALIPERTVRHDVARGILVAVELRPELTRPLGIVHRRGREFTPLIEALIAKLREPEPPNPRESDRPAA